MYKENYQNTGEVFLPLKGHQDLKEILKSLHLFTIFCWEGDALGGGREGRRGKEEEGLCIFSQVAEAIQLGFVLRTKKF